MTQEMVTISWSGGCHRVEHDADVAWHQAEAVKMGFSESDVVGIFERDADNSRMYHTSHILGTRAFSDALDD